jgi:hypothetical protein
MPHLEFHETHILGQNLTAYISRTPKNHHPKKAMVAGFKNRFNNNQGFNTIFCEKTSAYLMQI